MSKNRYTCRAYEHLQCIERACYHKTYMHLITIPKNLATRDDLVVVPRKEYEALLALKRYGEFTPTISQKKSLLAAEGNLKKGKTLSYHALVEKLGFTR